MGTATLAVGGGLGSHALAHPASYSHWGLHRCEQPEGWSVETCVDVGQSFHSYGYGTDASVLVYDHAAQEHVYVSAGNRRSHLPQMDATTVRITGTGVEPVQAGNRVNLGPFSDDQWTGVIVGEPSAPALRVGQEAGDDGCRLVVDGTSTGAPTSAPCPGGVAVPPVPVLPYLQPPFPIDP